MTWATPSQRPQGREISTDDMGTPKSKTLRKGDIDIQPGDPQVKKNKEGRYRHTTWGPLGQKTQGREISTDDMGTPSQRPQGREISTDDMGTPHS